MLRATGRADARLVRRLELAQTLGRLGGWVIDLTIGEGMWSDEGYRVLGLEPDSAAPTLESFVAQVHPDDQARMRLLNVDGMDTGAGYATEYRAVWPSGEVRWVRAAVEFDTDPVGRVTRIYGILEDVAPDPDRQTAADIRAPEHAG